MSSLVGLKKKFKEDLSFVQKFSQVCQTETRAFTTSQMSDSQSMKVADYIIKSKSMCEERKSYEQGEFIDQKLLKQIFSTVYESKTRAIIELDQLRYNLNWVIGDECRRISGKFLAEIEAL